ncbi:hypothetical protein Taro_043136 [Colocasia esculenta]|uniref:Uncharacterized protein n=1 Tax=Colocasia esculenta TaxID=4460 RepID=A0A843WK93_COLES|nr:hypothetical protein [Colocasia esculenta]
MASIRAAVTSARAFPRRQIPPSLPPAHSAAASSSEGCIAGGVSSLAAEDVPGSTPEASGVGGGSDRSSGLGTLSSLFARSSTSSIPKYAGKDGGVESGSGGRSRFAASWSRMRPVRPAESGSSVGSGRAREVTPEMASLIKRLHDEGYLKNNFLQEVDSNRIVANGYARGVLVTAAERFGEDNQEIAKWLSGSSLKKVALCGCPCTERKMVFAAKRLRSFFCIQEDIVCRGCPMKNSCKFVNQNVNREGKLILADVLRVLTACPWDSVPSSLKLQKELNHSVAKSLKEVMSLSA